ncbi:OLC1v1005858C1 [Oldenlandia corymbosa var. corymbosa]|uniref:cyclin-dependent kinase n=1 Tax=Oldenlandia corymbosa var. corymbosa TaxID=529605 RepID=A0AAV1DFY7_OLDCO|nr:OLC1v1005858C1 [Oldenlandia corymbosa var. corymbosa]
MGSRTVDCFEKPELIGEGTYGQVYRAKEIETGEIVALKKIRMDSEKEGFPITAIREIKILKELNHDNIIKLKEMVISPGPDNGIYMVFEYMDHDLTGLLDRPGIRFSVPQVKCYMRQLLTGVHYCHANRVLHRDIKSSNLLIDNNGNLKLADFGLSRRYLNDVNANLTNRVVTLWYRAPELLLGATKYGPAIDMWSVGCVFAELLMGKTIFPGKDEPQQLNLIFGLCGSPDEKNWPGVSKLPGYNTFKPEKPLERRVRETFWCVDKHALELLDRMLTLDPAKRISARDALDAEYFWADPLPCDPRSLPKYESSHEFDTKRKRQQQRLQDDAAKRQRLQHTSQHNRLLPPPQHSGQGYPQMRPGPFRHPQDGNPYGRYNHQNQAQGGGGGGRYANVPYPPPPLRGPPRGPSRFSGVDPRGGGGYGAGGPNYQHGDQYGAPGTRRGSNTMSRDQNQQYNRQH